MRRNSAIESLTIRVKAVISESVKGFGFFAIGGHESVAWLARPLPQILSAVWRPVGLQLHIFNPPKIYPAVTTITTSGSVAVITKSALGSVTGCSSLSLT
ncbi:hypothetical protein [Nitrosomonas europaea]|uniref:hypothetical protein n=1 Tax=Nitrosomonas europaea TaxID=915 RepID=UPI00117CF8FC|nr:hypothetical protein [Nitrosomonas europaea]